MHRVHGSMIYTSKKLGGFCATAGAWLNQSQPNRVAAVLSAAFRMSSAEKRL